MDLEDILDEVNRSPSDYSLRELIKSEQERLDVSQRQLCRALGVERRSLQRVLNGEAKSLDVRFLDKLSAFFQEDPKDLIEAHRSEEDREEIERVKKAGFMLRQFDLSGLRDLGVLDTITDLEHAENRIETFFGLDTIYDFADEFPERLHSETDYGLSHRMRRFWARAVYKQFSEINNPYSFEQSKLEDLSTRIREYTRDVENGFLHFIRELYRTGVTVIVESYVLNSAVYGATMIVDEKPCIVLTDRDKRYDILWRTLAHELFHAIGHRDQIRRQGYHLTGERSLLDKKMEKQADQFSTEVFVPGEMRDKVRPHIHTAPAVRKVADEVGVHPSLIYGLYLDWDLEDASEEFRKKEYSKLRSKLPRSEPALGKFKHLQESTWKKETIQETIPLIEKTLSQDQTPSNQQQTN